MTSGVPFGNPDNPFNEPAEIPDYRLASDPVRGTASKIIRFMSDYPEIYTEAVEDDFSVRSIAFDCTAPFAPDLGVYLNGTSALLGAPTGPVERTPARLSLGDLVTGGQIVKRWVQLSRPGEGEFGVSGVSRKLADGAFESWTGLTMLMEAQSGKAEAKLWGETTDTGGNIAAHALSEGDDQCFEAHFIAMYKALLRSLEKRQ